ncbi:hypothetical protein GWI33_011790 [Rhynchophorus ferrugineus]|uniref:Uncharacterized protein n=1 Tax=Rhynchophorus ferrugineus TaxID=354439 RepID=A0A834MEL0_RHYFE|nr:hypothetical protein GWI33_011790 [Rhynchophorus ferrugineus]
MAVSSNASTAKSLATHANVLKTEIPHQNAPTAVNLILLGMQMPTNPESIQTKKIDPSSHPRVENSG